MTNLSIVCGKLPRDISLDALCYHLEFDLNEMFLDTFDIRMVLSNSSHPIEDVSKRLSEVLKTSIAYVVADWNVYRKSTAYVRALHKIDISDYVIIVNYDKSGLGKKTKATRSSEDLCKKKGKVYHVIDMSFDEQNNAVFSNMEI